MVRFLMRSDRKFPDGMRLALLVLLLVAPAAFALDPSRAISQYGHTVWSVQDGFLPGAPTEMVQTTDGYLWIGTRLGLQRYQHGQLTSYPDAPGWAMSIVAGLGIAKLPPCLTEAYPPGALISVMTRFPVAPCGVYVVRPPGRHLVRKVGVLTDLLVQHLDNPLSP